MRILNIFFLSFNFLYIIINAQTSIEDTRSSTSILGPYNISMITVSGLSSGGYMAVQMHLSHSVRISGAAIFAAVII